MPAPRDQPRWPRGAPDDPEGKGQGGRWRDRNAATGWSDQLFTRITGRPAWADRSLIARLALQRPKRTRRLSGGAVAQTEELTYDDGTVAVRKTFHDDDGERAASAEYLSSLVADAVGALAPAVVKDPINPDRAVIMGRVNGELGTVHTGTKGPEDWGEARYWYTETDAGRRIGLLDVLVANRDRHSANWILSNELSVNAPWGDQGPVRRPIPIDHSETFQDTLAAQHGLRVVDPQGTGSYTAPLELMAYRGFMGAWMQPAQELASGGVTVSASSLGGTLGYREKNPLHPGDIPVLRARLEALRPRFADEGMLEHYMLMMRRFDHLARRAAGTDRMFP